MDTANLVIVVIVLVLIIIIGYYVSSWFSSFPLTDCAKYGVIHTIGTTGGPQCSPGAQEYGGVCYTDVWTKNNGKKTAVCTVEYPGSYSLVTDCFLGIGNLYIGDACDTLAGWTAGPNYYKTAVCTCERGGPITASQ